jgi:DNA adenine methylase
MRRSKKAAQYNKPFFKYVGGKLQFAKAIARLMPPKYGIGTFDDYYEPFLGGGAIALEMLSRSAPKTRKVFLSDITPELINVWQCVQRNPLKLLRKLNEIPLPTCLEDFQAVRLEYNMAKSLDIRTGAKWLAEMNDIERFAIAARYIYLNKCGVNGIYRVNKGKNEFNISWNKNLKPCFPNHQHLAEVSLLIRDAEITCQTFAIALKDVKENDLVYVDPPYFKTYNDYTANGFGVEGQIHLFNVLQNMCNRGAHVFASNSDTEYVRSLYSDWERVVLSRTGTVSCGEDRSNVNELLMFRRAMEQQKVA